MFQMDVQLNKLTLKNSEQSIPEIIGNPKSSKYENGPQYGNTNGQHIPKNGFATSTSESSQHEADFDSDSCVSTTKTSLPTWNVNRYEIYIKPDTEKINKTELIQEFVSLRPGVHYQPLHKQIHSIVVAQSDKQEFLFIKLSPELDPISENLEDETNNNDDNIPSAFHYILPNQNFVGLWESLIYDDESLKPRLFNFMQTIQMFSERGVDSNLISLNKLILLHGPPGSGKTTLCHALAQKLTVQLVAGTKPDGTSFGVESSKNSNLKASRSGFNSGFKYGQMIEINCHSLFSRWFSESGKLVMKQFQKIREVAEDEECLVFVLVDEIESVASNRSNINSGTEPTDSVRVVNAILTQLDSLKNFKNVLVLSTGRSKNL